MAAPLNHRSRRVTDSVAPRDEEPRASGLLGHARGGKQAGLAALGLAGAGGAVPLAAAAWPQLHDLLGPPALSLCLLALLIVISAAVGVTAAWLGLPQIAASFRAANTGEPGVTVARVFTAAAVFGWTLIGSAILHGDAGWPPVAVAAFALCVAWGELLDLMLRPSGAWARLFAALLVDIVLLSLLLACGGPIAAPFYPLYFAITIIAALRCPGAALVPLLVASLAGFTGAIATSGFWQQEPTLTVGLWLALGALPAGLAAPLREGAELRQRVAEDAAPALDRYPVLIISGDRRFAEGLLQLIAHWNGDGQWLGDAELAFARLARLASGPPPIVILDGREQPLSALALIREVRAAAAIDPVFLLVADPDYLAAFDGQNGARPDRLLAVPLNRSELAAALHEIAEPSRLAASASAPPASVPPEARQPEPPLADHPLSSAPEFELGALPTPVVDRHAIGSLSALGGDPGFLRELAEDFAEDAHGIIRRAEQAMAASDAMAFSRALRDLRHAASHVGGVRLGELITSLESLDYGELCARRSRHLKSLEAEIHSLMAELLERGEAEASLP